MYNYNGMQPIDPAYVQYATSYFPGQPMVVPAAQPPFIIVANPSAPVYSAPYFAPVYYQDGNSQSGVPATDSSVRPLLTSTPLPSDCLTPARNHFAARGNIPTDVLADLSKISINDETVELSPKEFRVPQKKRLVAANYRTKISGMPLPQIRNPRFKTRLCKHYEVPENQMINTSYLPECPYGVRCEFIHPTDREFKTLPIHEQAAVLSLLQRSHTSHNDTTPEMAGDCPSLPSVSRSAVKHSHEKVLLKNRNVAGSMMCLAFTGIAQPKEDQPKYGSLRRAFPARSVMNLNNLGRTARRSVSQANIATLKRSSSMQFLADGKH